MTRQVLTLAPDEDLTRIEEGMARFRIRHLPVVEDGRLIGLVSHRDILRASSSTLRAAHADRDADIQTRFRVEDVMQKDMQTVHASLSLLHAAEQMWSEQRGCLPVVDEHYHLVGIVTEADFLKVYILSQGGKPTPRGRAGSVTAFAAADAP